MATPTKATRKPTTTKKPTTPKSPPTTTVSDPVLEAVDPVESPTTTTSPPVVETAPSPQTPTAPPGEAPATGLLDTIERVFAQASQVVNQLTVQQPDPELTALAVSDEPVANHEIRTSPDIDQILQTVQTLRWS